MQLTLTAPAKNGQPSGARLGHAQCGFALPDVHHPHLPHAGRVPLHLPKIAQVPDFHLWHAQKAAPAADAIAASVAAEQSALATAARAQDWAALFLGRDPRNKRRSAGSRQRRTRSGREMARHMQDAVRAHPVHSSKPRRRLPPRLC